MKKFINCMTYALDIEGYNLLNSELKLWYSLDPFVEISTKCQDTYHRTCRKVNSVDDLLDGEWLVVFFGFVAIKFDYEGRPEDYDYHFARRESNGTWTERPSVYTEIQDVDIDNMISEYAKIGIKPMFLAIGKVED